MSLLSDEDYQKIGQGTAYFITILFVAFAAGKVFMYSFNEVNQIRDRADKYQSKYWSEFNEQSRTQDRLGKIGNELCENEFGNDFSFDWTEPVEAEFGDKKAQLKAVSCSNGSVTDPDAVYKEIRIQDNNLTEGETGE